MQRTARGAGQGTRPRGTRVRRPTYHGHETRAIRIPIRQRRPRDVKVEIDGREARRRRERLDVALSGQRVDIQHIAESAANNGE